jgi:uncharacterized Tic20 family protein
MTQQNTFLGTEETALIPPTSDEKTMAILSHILCIVAGFIAPLIIYLVKKDESPYVRAHARESLNFQLTMVLAYFVSAILIFVLIGILLIWVLIIANLVLIVIATIRASEGKLYKYPFSIKFVK